MATAELQSSLAHFVTFARSLKGDEKSEAQSFLDQFFRALGHASAIEAGATFEFRIAKKPGSAQLELIEGEAAKKAKSGKKYGDLVWPGRVLIEMKSRGENLEKHYDLTKLREVLRDLRLFRVLDPACGSGNFLFIAYRVIKRLERTLLLALRDAGERPERLATGILLTNFFGLDVVPFAVELAKVTLMLAKELELREADKFADDDGLHLPERPLPLDNLDQQILCADSLFTDWPAAA